MARSRQGALKLSARHLLEGVERGRLSCNTGKEKDMIKVKLLLLEIPKGSQWKTGCSSINGLVDFKFYFGKSELCSYKKSIYQYWLSSSLKGPFWTLRYHFDPFSSRKHSYFWSFLQISYKSFSFRSMRSTTLEREREVRCEAWGDNRLYWKWEYLVPDACYREYWVYYLGSYSKNKLGTFCVLRT